MRTLLVEDDQTELDVEGPDARADDYLIKPYNVRDLPARIPALTCPSAYSTDEVSDDAQRHPHPPSA